MMNQCQIYSAVFSRHLGERHFMKSVTSSLITRKSTGFTSTLRGLFVALFVLGFGPNLEAVITLV